MRTKLIAFAGLLASAVAGFVSGVADLAHRRLFGYMQRAGLALALGPNGEVTAADFGAGVVMNPNQSEIIRQGLYDYQVYATAGATSMSFFQVPIGQGNTSAVGATAGTPKTLFDTNMQLGGQLANGAAYLIQSIEVVFAPGSVSTANTYTLAVIGDFTAVAADAVYGAVNDVNIFYQSGALELNIFQKNYIRETPLALFPPKAWLGVDSSQGNNSATTGSGIIQLAKSVGRPYYVEPFITLKPAVNFVVNLIWPAVVATPSGFNGRVGVRFDGCVMRASQ